MATTCAIAPEVEPLAGVAVSGVGTRAAVASMASTRSAGVAGATGSGPACSGVNGAVGQCGLGASPIGRGVGSSSWRTLEAG